MYAKNDTSDVIKLPNNVLMVGGNVRLYFWKTKLCSVSSFGGSVYYRSRWETKKILRTEDHPDLCLFNSAAESWN